MTGRDCIGPSATEGILGVRINSMLSISQNVILEYCCLKGIHNSFSLNSVLVILSVKFSATGLPN